MTTVARNYLFLTLIFLALAGIGYLLQRFFTIELSFQEIVLLLSGGFLISLITAYVFFRGIKKSEKSGIVHTLSAIGLKFLLFLALLGIFALLKRELSLHFLVGFFVIYLSFTFYLLFTFVNLLKKNNKVKPDDKGN